MDQCPETPRASCEIGREGACSSASLIRYRTREVRGSGETLSVSHEVRQSNTKLLLSSSKRA
eukprot:3213572-Pleurochrysis_carterae.AAC.2